MSTDLVRYSVSGNIAEIMFDRAPVIAGKLAAKSPIVMKIGRDAFMRAVDAGVRLIPLI